MVYDRGDSLDFLKFRYYGKLTSQEVKNIDSALDSIKMSDVFGGSKIIK